MIKRLTHGSVAYVAGCAVIWLLSTYPIWAEQVILYLRNGDRLSGNIIMEDTNRVVLSTSWTNRLELPRSQIERRETRPETGVGQKTTSSTNLAVVIPAASSTNLAAAPNQKALSDKQRQQLGDLLAQYQADKITASQYQEQRHRILAGGGEAVSGATATNLAPAAGTAAQTVAGKPAGTPGAPAKAGGGAAVAKTTGSTTNSLRHRLHLDNWHGNLQVGANLGFSTVHNEAYNAIVQANYAKGVLKHAIEYHLAYGKADQTLSANRMDGSMKTEVDFKKGLRLYGYHLGAAGFDEVRQINLNYQEGAGLGYHLVQRTNLALNVEFGGSYQNYEYSNHMSSEYVSFRIGQEMTWKPYPKLSIIQKAQIIPNVSDINEFKIRGEATISYPFMTNLTLNLNFIENYDSRPPATADHNDLQILTTLGYKF